MRKDLCIVFGLFSIVAIVFGLLSIVKVLSLMRKDLFSWGRGQRPFFPLAALRKNSAGRWRLNTGLAGESGAIVFGAFQFCTIVVLRLYKEELT